MWKAEAILGNADSIMSIARGFRAMIEAITMTNSGKPIGRWFDETQASALMSVTQQNPHSHRLSTGHAALHKRCLEMAAPQGHLEAARDNWAHLHSLKKRRKCRNWLGP